MIDDLLDLLDRNPSYCHFMLDGQTIILEDYLTIRPEREADLRRFIQSGRISIGPWYILLDKFFVSPEATARNLLESVRTARMFGPRMMPDPSRKLPYKIENKYFQVEAGTDGTISVLDRRSAILYSGLNRFAACGDRGDTYNFAAVAGETDSTARLKGAACAITAVHAVSIRTTL